MKITIVLGAFFPVPPIMGGAVEKVWFALAREFARRGHHVVEISRTMPQLHRRESIAGVQHVRVRGFDAPRSLLWLKFLDLIYSARVMAVLPEADVVVTNTFWLPILLRSSKRGKVYVHVARYPKGQMRFYRRAARLQAPSEAVAGAIFAEAPQLRPKTKVIPYPVPEIRNNNESPPPLAERSRTILFVGRVHPEKGVHLLIEAFAGLPRDLAAEWKLSIVGPAEEELGGGGQSYLAGLKRSALKAGGKVFFQGPVFDPAALEQNFRSARLFVYPSLADLGESFGLAPLEAMAHGCAVIVSNLGCFRDFIRDHETGFIFDHHAAGSPVNALREKLQQAIANSESLARVAEAGYRESAKYSVSRVADQFLHDFSSLTGQSDVPGTDR
jgi:glycosyltransferase involved in cell wall biosynthesis